MDCHATLAQLIALRDRVASHPASEADRSLDLLLEGLAALFGGVAACCALTRHDPEVDKRDPLGGWQVVLSRRWTADSAQERATDAALGTDALSADAATLSSLEHAGTGARAHFRRDRADTELSPPPESGSSPLIKPPEHLDELIGAVTLETGVEAWVGLSRAASQGRFVEDERKMLAHAMALLRPELAQFAMLQGVAGTHQLLTPRERDVLRGLLTAATEREIARELGIMKSSVHQVVMRVYRKFGVRSRAELLSKWLDGAPALPALAG